MRGLVCFIGIGLGIVTRLGFAGSLGSTTSTEFSPGFNLITTQYSSCTGSLRAAIGVHANFTKSGARVRPGELNEVGIETEFEGKKLHATVIEGLEVNGLKTVFVPRAKFLLYSSESLHKSISAMATFEGYYLLFPAEDKEFPLEDPVRKFLNRRFATISSLPREGSEKFYLVPIEQYTDLRAALNGETPLWTYVPTVPSPIASRDLTIETPGGTIYSFKVDGSIDIYPRTGKTSHIDGARVFEKPFASHREILLRQGIDVGNEDNPVRQTEIALATNASTISNYQKRHKIPRAVSGVITHVLDSSTEKFGASASGPNARHAALQEGVQAGDELSALIPTHLRWTKIEDPTLYSAPEIKKGQFTLRVVHPFLFIRPATGAKFARPTVRLLPDSAVHIQGLHAQLGNFGLVLEKEGLVTGGHLAFEYDPQTKALVKIAFESNGLISLDYQRGKRLRLTPEEATYLAKYLGENLGYQIRKDVEIDFEHPVEP